MATRPPRAFASRWPAHTENRMATEEIGNPHLHGGDVDFLLQVGNDWIPCRISREALEDHFGAKGDDPESRVPAYIRNREVIDEVARRMYARVSAAGDVVNAKRRLLLKTAQF